jgi:hypothetical protein
VCNYVLRCFGFYLLILFFIVGILLFFFVFFVFTGHLARAGGTLTSDFVEFEVKRGLEWLQGPFISHAFAAFMH